MNRRKRENSILDAAVRVFSRRGFSKTSVSEIIDEANVARGTFYLYFKSKKDVFTALLERFMMEVSQGIAKINVIEASGEGDLASQFRNRASDLIAAFTRNRQLTKIILFHGEGFSEFDSKLTLFHDTIANLIKRNLDLQIQAGLFRPCLTDLVARSIIGSVKEMIRWWITEDRFEIEAAIQGLIDHLLQGVLPVIPLEKGVLSQEKPANRSNVNLH